jgi:hypothetical protein
MTFHRPARNCKRQPRAASSQGGSSACWRARRSCGSDCRRARAHRSRRSPHACVVEDHSDFAGCELHRRQGAETCAGVLEREPSELRELGLLPPRAVNEGPRLRLHEEPLLPRAARRDRRPPGSRSDSRAALELQGRALHRNAAPRVSLSPAPSRDSGTCARALSSAVLSSPFLASTAGAGRTARSGSPSDQLRTTSVARTAPLSEERRVV